MTMRLPANISFAAPPTDGYYVRGGHYPWIITYNDYLNARKARLSYLEWRDPGDEKKKWLEKWRTLKRAGRI